MTLQKSSRLGWLCVSFLVLLGGCSALDPERKADSEVVGSFDQADVAGVVTKIQDTIPVDGGVLFLSLKNSSGDELRVSVRGPNWGYQLTEQEEVVLKGAYTIQVGDLIEAQLTDGYVSAYRVTRR